MHYLPLLTRCWPFVAVGTQILAGNEFLKQEVYKRHRLLRNMYSTTDGNSLRVLAAHYLHRRLPCLYQAHKMLLHLPSLEVQLKHINCNQRSGLVQIHP